jgi:hypothetical protein
VRITEEGRNIETAFAEATARQAPNVEYPTSNVCLAYFVSQDLDCQSTDDLKE